MKKLKLYFDTSVVSVLDRTSRPDWTSDTLELWEDIKQGLFEVFISPVVVGELMESAEPKRTILFDYLREIPFTELEEIDEVNILAQKYLDAGILEPKSYDDCLHIAYACVYDCDILVSFNFKHLVNYRTISGVKSVNAMAGYREMPIYTPTMLVSGGADDDS
jgi:predicted nucleic acid-binding protein